MTRAELFEAIRAAGIPAVYHHWPESETPVLPRICFYFTGSADIHADNRNYINIERLSIDLYTANKDPETEAALEAALKAAGIPWDADEDYLTSEKIYVKEYTTEVLIHGE